MKMINNARHFAFMRFAGAVDIEKVDSVELIASLDRNPARKTRFIARHGVKEYLRLCDRARRC